MTPARAMGWGPIELSTANPAVDSACKSAEHPQAAKDPQPENEDAADQASGQYGAGAEKFHHCAHLGFGKSEIDIKWCGHGAGHACPRFCTAG